MEKIYFHIFLFQGLKILSLKVTHIDLGKYSHHWNQSLQKLWEISVDKLLMQWRYESGNVDYKKPEILVKNDSLENQTEPLVLTPKKTPLLVCNGGGKDSLLMASLLGEHQIYFDSFSTNLHTYANYEKLFELNEQHLKFWKKYINQVHRLYWIDSFMNSPSAQLHGIDNLYLSHHSNFEPSPLASGIFSVLPIILQEKYTMLCYGNEKSSESDNLKVNDISVNHAWCKTTESEILYETYIQEVLVRNLSIFSLIKPYSDTIVYRILSNQLKDNQIKQVYSCNLNPPWCKSCPKCAYVWLSFMAYLKPEHQREVATMFDHQNLFDLPQMQIYYQEMLGLGKHKPFECVGEIEEVKLAFEKCVEQGMSGQAIDQYLQNARLDRKSYQEIWEKYNSLDYSYQRLPKKLLEAVTQAYSSLP
ncbi:hypothetical protein PN462_16105 [Spirulina sp. CS-785/01]|uniref:hypothetical protein n=1 Tax=Spirulina sp. CS-785/01 TaxID=3021716 RepID=UPI00232EE6AB|nr:hypothetical protein [Spirulina sp. CS-785/01]MDB9314636.1 hypothetical protein [Spirulina sp. CS-785/01]